VHQLGIWIDQYDSVRQLHEQQLLCLGDLIGDVARKCLCRHGIGKSVAYMRLRGWRGLRWRTRKPLANCPLLRWGQIGVVVAGRLLGGGEAGAADDPEGDYACSNELVHDCLLMADGVGPIAFIGTAPRANRVTILLW